MDLRELISVDVEITNGLAFLEETFTQGESLFNHSEANIFMGDLFHIFSQ